MRGPLLSILIAAGLLGTLAAPLADDRMAGGCHTNTRGAESDVWPGWRGADAQGKTPDPLPTHWGADKRVHWKTPIPGRGHSSPIVYGNRVYITTAEVTAGGVLLDNAGRLLTLGLVLVVASLALRLVADRCRTDRAPTSSALAAGMFILTVALVLVLTACCGDELFDLARSPIRGWIVSTVFASLCLALAANSVDRGSVQWLIGLSAVVLAAFVLAAFPSQRYAFYRGIPSLRLPIAVATAGVPVVVGMGSVLAAGTRSCSCGTRRILMAGFGLAVTVSAVVLLRRLLDFRDDGFPEVQYVARISVWLLLLPVAWTAAWFCRGLLPASLPVRVALVACGALSMVVTAAIAIERLAKASPYLAYHLGTPRVAPLGGATLGAVGAGVALHAMWAGRKRRMLAHAHLPALGFMAVALGALFFVRVNFVHRYTGMARAIVSLDRRSGDVRWIARALEGPQPAIDGRNSPATPTPVTDARLVCGYFGTAGLMCATMEGRVAWTRTDLAYEGMYGVGFSPLLVDGLLIVASDMPNGFAVIQALDVRTGTSVWTRRFTTTPTWTGNSRTPIVHRANGIRVLILWGMEYVKGLALRSGETIWEFPYTSGGDLVASAVADDHRLYLSAVGGTVALDHADLAAGRNPIRWANKAAANCASPVLANGLLFTVTDAGIAAAIDAGTGEIAWRHRLPGQYVASPVASPAAVYFTNNEGLTTVVAAERTFRILGQNQLRDETVASMAAAGCELFIRSAGYMYAIQGQ